MKIAMLEGAPGVARFVERGLTSEGWTVTVLPDTNAALDHLGSAACDLLILDMETGSGDALPLVAKAREAVVGLPVLILRSDSGQTGNAPDTLAQVLQKPFAFEDLIEKVDAAKKAKKKQPGPIRSAALALRFDPATRRVGTSQGQTTLSDDEAALLTILMKYPGRPYSTELLCRALKDAPNAAIDCPVAKTIDALRTKLGPEADAIITVKNYGYRFTCAK
ncbi:MAG: winged helix-turn-helix domain-containing protein [Pseudomonadota bacterium]